MGHSDEYRKGRNDALAGRSLSGGASSDERQGHIDATVKLQEEERWRRENREQQARQRALLATPERPSAAGGLGCLAIVIFAIFF
jgi:hypothetical protein